MDVRVDTDAGFSEAEGDREVGRLAPDAGKEEQVLDRVGHCPVMTRQQDPGDRANLLRLRPVEAGRVDRLFDRGGRQLQHPRRIARFCEQAFGRRVGDLVFRAEREDATDEDAERVGTVRGDEPIDRVAGGELRQDGAHGPGTHKVSSGTSRRRGGNARSMSARSSSVRTMSAAFALWRTCARRAAFGIATTLS